MNIEDINLGAARLINDLVIAEFRAQGHSLTGEFEASLKAEMVKTKYTSTLKTTGLKYGMILNDGVEPGKINKSMIPGLVQYFIKRGFPLREASAFAINTYKKWLTEGMSTQASKRFSSTGGRQHFIEAAITGHENIIDNYVTNLFDFGVEQQFEKTKNERI